MQQYSSIIAALALIFRMASAGTASLSFVLLALFAFCGRVQAILALFISWFFVMLNPGVAPVPQIGSAGRVMVALAAFVSVLVWSRFLTRRLRTMSFLVATVLLGFFLILHSLAVSPMRDVSILKVVYWLLAMSTMLIGWGDLSKSQFVTASRFILAGLVVTMLVSLPLVVSDTGYLVNGHGFQGVLNHPQAFGLTMALLGSWLAGRMLGELQPPIWTMMLLGVCIVSIFLSEARTAGMAMVLSVALAVFVAPSFAGISVRNLIPGLLSPRLWLIGGLVVVLAIPALPSLFRAVERFVQKGTSGSTSLTDVYSVSRGTVIDKMTVNIADHPFAGIGFGIASDPYEMEVERDPLFDLPVSASVEKGVGPLAVVEETGALGALFTGAWLFMLLRGAARSGFVPFVIAMTAIVMNMGEYMLFSAGGSGLLVLLMLTWAYSGRILRDDRAAERAVSDYERRTNTFDEPLTSAGGVFDGR